MTMADEIDQLDNAREMSNFQLSNNNNSLITNQNMPWKQRKRKRLSAVLDKLHNNNTITKRCLNDIESNNNNNNNSNINNNNSTDIDNNQDGEASKHLTHDVQRSVIGKTERESIKSGGAGEDDDDRTTNASDDFRSSIDSPLVKQETFSSPFEFNGNDENAFNGDNIKQEERISNFEYPTLNEQQLSSVERYFPQISSPLFEYYLQTKYLPDILRMRNMQLQQSEQKTKPSSTDQQYSPVSQQRKSSPQKQTEQSATTSVPPRKRQKQAKHQQQYPNFSDKASPPPQDTPLDLSMKTILENISKATTTHKQTTKQNAVKASTSTSYNRWHNQLPQDLSASIPNLANILMNQTHLNNHSAFAVAQRSRSPNEAKPNVSSNAISQVPIIKGDVASPTTKESVAFRYNLNVSPVVEEMPPGTDVAYVCPICGQMFSLHDRLAKHMASRHKSKSSSSEITKSYVCEVCDRSFARSDMLTRHMRLHTGIKPYTCKVCNQVFSRSDHLSTHQRTHTGEKPYKCPQCPYAACRRDMITRHMRTHARYEAQRAAAAAAVASQAVAAAAAVVNDPASIDGSRMSFAQMQRNLLAGANLSEVNIKMEDDATTSVSPRTLSPAYGPTACIKTENICS